jgi:hypothetical protein
MITSGLRDLFTRHGCEVVATGCPELSSVGMDGLHPDVLVVDSKGDGPEVGRRLHQINPSMALIIIDDAHMTVYPPGGSAQPYRSPLTEERLLSAATAL